MKESEKIQLKLDILKDIRSCMRLDFMSVQDRLDIDLLDEQINAYKHILLGMQYAEEKGKI